MLDEMWGCTITSTCCVQLLLDRYYVQDPLTLLWEAVLFVEVHLFVFLRFKNNMCAQNFLEIAHYQPRDLSSSLNRSSDHVPSVPGSAARRPYSMYNLDVCLHAIT